MIIFVSLQGPSGSRPSLADCELAHGRNCGWSLGARGQPGPTACKKMKVLSDAVNSHMSGWERRALSRDTFRREPSWHLDLQPVILYAENSRNPDS